MFAWTTGEEYDTSDRLVNLLPSRDDHVHAVFNRLGIDINGPEPTPSSLDVLVLIV